MSPNQTQLSRRVRRGRRRSERSMPPLAPQGPDTQMKEGFYYRPLIQPLNSRPNVCMSVCTYVCMYACLCVAYAYLHIFICLSIYIYIYVESKKPTWNKILNTPEPCWVSVPPGMFRCLALRRESATQTYVSLPRGSEWSHKRRYPIPRTLPIP